MTYGFSAGTWFPGITSNPPLPVSPAMRATFQQALALWSQASGLDFLEVPSLRFATDTTSFVLQDIFVSAVQFNFGFHRSADGFARPGDRAGITLYGAAPSVEHIALAVGTAIGVAAPPATFLFGNHSPILVAVPPDLEAARLLYGTAAEKAEMECRGGGMPRQAGCRARAMPAPTG